MRDPKRMEPLLQQVYRNWRRSTDLRLLQSLAVVILPGEDIFHIEDDVLAARLKIMAQPGNDYIVKQARMVIHNHSRFTDKVKKEVIAFLKLHQCMHTDAEKWCVANLPEWSKLQ